MPQKTNESRIKLCNNDVWVIAISSGSDRRHFSGRGGRYNQNAMWPFLICLKSRQCVNSDIFHHSRQKFRGKTLLMVM